MSKVAHYLQEHLVGEVTDAPDTRRHFASDSSVLTLMPALVVYPKNESDIRKTARFSWQLAERGRSLPITARGAGSDVGGAAIGSGVVMVLPAHMNRVLQFNSKTGVVVVEPGINYGKLQQALSINTRFLPPFPASLEFSTIGGAVANNASGEKSLKYGSTRDYTQSLRVVLANGEVIETCRLNKRELSKKLGLATFEGEIYRAVDTLIEENWQTIMSAQPPLSKNTAGYALWDIKRPDGSFDLTPLLVGSQGTLGIVSEATLQTETLSPKSTLMAVFLDDSAALEEAVSVLTNLKGLPSAIELIGGDVLQFVTEHNPPHLNGIVNQPVPKITLLIEFDNQNDKQRLKLVNRAAKSLTKIGVSSRIETEPEGKEQLWKIRQSPASLLAQGTSNRAVPLIDDAVLPVTNLQAYYDQASALLQKHHLPFTVWGHIGNGNLHLQPSIDLSQIGDRQRVFRLMDDYYKMVIDLGGSTSGEHNDGRLRAPYLELMYGAEVYQLFIKIKQIFDPHNILNPGVKVGVKLDDIKPLLATSYSFKWHQFLPRAS